MKSKLSLIRSCLNWDVLRNVLLIVVMAILLSVRVTLPNATSTLMSHVQPILLKMAAEKPDATIGVIVQKSVKDVTVEELVANLGGTVTKDLSIINAFAAEMPAKHIAELTRADGVKMISLDAPVIESGGPDGRVDTAALLNVYNKAIGADKLWAEGYQGSSVMVAVIDSGLNSHNDIKGKIKLKVKTNSYPATTGDNFGHGTHVSGIINGDGSNSNGKYMGVAPKAQLVGVKVTDDQGRALSSDLVAGMQWVLNNKTKYNIRIASISLNGSTAESYHTSPVDAAAEILWFNGIVVVVSAGNNGSSGILYPPANDPFVITVGAVDDKGTVAITDDVLAAFSAYGTTESGISKPDLVAPGKNIISTLASSGSVLSTQHTANRVSGASTYFRMSGTSMSTPVVVGAIALLLQSNPSLKPDQVKYRLMATANKNWGGYNATKAGAGYLDVYAAVHGTTTASANTGKLASQLLWSGSTPVTWGSVNWDSVNWDSVNWDSVNWDSVNWDSVNWNSDYWGK